MMTFGMTSGGPPFCLRPAFGIDPKKVLTIFGEHGNIGPASVPIVLSKLRQLGRLKKGDRIALLGIGSGLNCSMAEVVW